MDNSISVYFILVSILLDSSIIFKMNVLEKGCFIKVPTVVFYECLWQSKAKTHMETNKQTKTLSQRQTVIN